MGWAVCGMGWVVWHGIGGEGVVRHGVGGVRHRVGGAAWDRR